MNRLLNLALLLVASMCLVYVLSMEPREKFVPVVDKVMPAVVEIHVSGLIETVDRQYMPATRAAKILGSGVYISSKGHILTCAHLFSDFKKIESITIVESDGGVVSGTLVKVSSKTDLAVVRVLFYDKTPKVKLADPRKLKVGQEVFAIGSPLGLSFTVTNGIISALYRDFEGAYNITQSDTVINPGNSGGPLFNLKGELVGINVFIISPNSFFPTFSGLGFSVQCGEIFRFLVDVKKIDKELVL